MPDLGRDLWGLMNMQAPYEYQSSKLNFLVFYVHCDLCDTIFSCNFFTETERQLITILS